MHALVWLQHDLATLSLHNEIYTIISIKSKIGSGNKIFQIIGAILRTM